MSKRVEVEIGRLVLHNVPPAQRQAVREAIEREVARRVRDGSLQAEAAAGPWTLPAATPAGPGGRSSS